MTMPDDVPELMAQLDSLLGAEDAATKLVRRGRAAVEPLRRFLLDGPPRVVTEPRCWAVRALAGLGEKDTLVEYLQRDRGITDPAVWLAETDVQRTAALALTEWRSEEIFDLLLRAAVRHPTPGLIEALGRFERREAVPICLVALADDVCRPWAEAALARVANRHRDLLLRGALAAAPEEQDAESPSDVRRRRAITGLLRDVRLSAADAHQLVPLLDAGDLETTVNVAAILITRGDDADRALARHALFALAPQAPWFLARDVQTLLERQEAQP